MKTPVKKYSYYQAWLDSTHFAMELNICVREQGLINEQMTNRQICVAINKIEDIQFDFFEHCDEEVTN